MNTKSMTATPSSPPPPILRLHGVTKAYRMGQIAVPALRGVSLEARPSEFVAVTGPSGSGKSTLLHLCGLIDRLDDGEYQLENQDTRQLTERERALVRREKIGFIFQGFNLVPVLTVFENVEVPLLLAGISPSGRAERTRGAIESVGLADLARRRPDELSGGQRQRVAVARALVTQPRLVLADEPTANLDSDTAAQVIEVMHQLARTHRATFLVATHDPQMAAHCDRTITLRDGVLT